jgi:hypothetical protein
MSFAPFCSTTTTRAFWPGFSSASTADSAPNVGVGAPLTETMMSPTRMPAFEAAPPGVMETTMAPVAAASPTRMPRKARCELMTFPWARICLVMSLTRLLGIAKPMPGALPPNCGSVAASVGIPITRPWMSTSAPPELPGLIAALV